VAKRRRASEGRRCGREWEPTTFVFSLFRSSLIVILCLFFISYFPSRYLLTVNRKKDIIIKLFFSGWFYNEVQGFGHFQLVIKRLTYNLLDD
jgi:hypothetical protein